MSDGYFKRDSRSYFKGFQDVGSVLVEGPREILQPSLVAEGGGPASSESGVSTPEQRHNCDVVRANISSI